ncbi:protein bem46 [Aspergillus udagawae]|uniref:Protein bem46 n=1 Tax=Aspergillus udagawae TaxID=91492 RepID=A0ABQ1B406_9EURO|nr:protein bem46 [Aspergillus udagawae]GFF92947.1 protein bem46 [Aspergillus udagawae]GFG24093.1 protein bem46 [Aspergillus udagawae]
MQDKLLYISWLPPFARSEQISDYAGECKPVRWEEKRIRSSDGTKLAVCEGWMPATPRSVTQKPHARARKKLVVICYFQGNGGSTPMRLPLLSQFLRTINPPTPSSEVDYLVVALSYRGYWKSSGRASQIGIELDAVAFLQWVAETYGAPDRDVRMVLWGHSLGTAIASSAAATYLARQSSSPRVPVSGMILEAPMSSTKDMLISLYPQKWLPYRYLWPFLWNNWSSAVALERMARWRDQDRDPQGHEYEHEIPPILLLSAENDEVIPAYAAAELEQEGRRLGLKVDRLDVSGAMHTEIPVKAAGRQAMNDFIKKCTTS